MQQTNKLQANQRNGKRCTPEKRPFPKDCWLYVSSIIRMEKQVWQYANDGIAFAFTGVSIKKAKIKNHMLQMQ